MKKALCLVAASGSALLLFTVPAVTEDNATAPVIEWMDALKGDWLGLSDQFGLALTPEIRQQMQRVSSLLPWRVLEYQVTDVKEDGGVALVTVHETSQRGPVSALPEFAKALTTGNVTVDERFVVIRLDGKWQIDFSHSGLHTADFSWVGLVDEAAEARAQQQLAKSLNGAGLGQITCSLAASVPTLATVSAAAVPNFRRAAAMGQMTACSSNQKNLATGLEMYASDYAGLYPRKLGDVRPDYLRQIPTCPSAKADTYSETYQVSTKPDSFTFYCRGHHHQKAGLGPNLPSYSTETGLVR